METESEEYRSHNSTESEIDLKEKGLVVIEDVNTVSLQWRQVKLQSFTNAGCFSCFFLPFPCRVTSEPSLSVLEFCIVLYVK